MSEILDELRNEHKQSDTRCRRNSMDLSCNCEELSGKKDSDKELLLQEIILRRKIWKIRKSMENALTDDSVFDSLYKEYSDKSMELAEVSKKVDDLFPQARV